jgi:hypothetical protein
MSDRNAAVIVTLDIRIVVEDYFLSARTLAAKDRHDSLPKLVIVPRLLDKTDQLDLVDGRDDRTAIREPSNDHARHCWLALDHA